MQMKVAGLFSGIGGLELPFHRLGVETVLLCERWQPAIAVLEARFPSTHVHPDVCTLNSLPEDATILTAGFPCTDLSQAGRTAGIGGSESGLVSHVFRLLRSRSIEWLVLENVRNMLVLDRGRAMHYLTSELESLGFRWAYRVVDSRFSGVPQRRHRVLLVASRQHDPRTVLFADDHGEPADSRFQSDAFGFYWTEGYTGLGWARDAVPPLKGGSTVGIPSPPAIWRPGAPVGMKLATPCIEDAERFQGFDAGWTSPAEDGRSNGPRWKLIGNAVTVGVADWLASRIVAPGVVNVERLAAGAFDRWPEAAYGERGKVSKFDASHWPVCRPYKHLSGEIRESSLKPLSARATAGFLQRVARSSLRFDQRFLVDAREHLLAMNRTPGIDDLFVLAAAG